MAAAAIMLVGCIGGFLWAVAGAPWAFGFWALFWGLGLWISIKG